MMIMRNAERNAQWRHTLQSGIETARVPLDELTPHAENSRRYWPSGTKKA